MNNDQHQCIMEEWTVFLQTKEFPCVAARAAIEKKQVKCMVADHMACPKDDEKILQFIHDFVDEYRAAANLFHSVCIIFKEPVAMNETMFDALLWQRLQALSNLDALRYGHDTRVNADPSSTDFSFSLKEEAFFIIGVHPASNRAARRFKYPALAFNPHAQFVELRNTHRYDKMKNIVRKRDIIYSGSVNPMLEDFGESSEVYQYSGQVYDKQWECPLKTSYDI